MESPNEQQHTSMEHNQSIPDGTKSLVERIRHFTADMPKRGFDKEARDLETLAVSIGRFTLTPEQATNRLHEIFKKAEAKQIHTPSWHPKTLTISFIACVVFTALIILQIGSSYSSDMTFYPQDTSIPFLSLWLHGFHGFTPKVLFITLTLPNTVFIVFILFFIFAFLSSTLMLNIVRYWQWKHSPVFHNMGQCASEIIQATSHSETASLMHTTSITLHSDSGSLDLLTSPIHDNQQPTTHYERYIRETNEHLKSLEEMLRTETNEIEDRLQILEEQVSSQKMDGANVQRFVNSIVEAIETGALSREQSMAKYHGDVEEVKKQLTHLEKTHGSSPELVDLQRRVQRLEQEVEHLKNTQIAIEELH